MYPTSRRQPNPIKIALYVFLGLLGLMIIFGSFGVVDAGERGVKVRLGNVVGTVESGVYFKLPFIESVKKFDVRTQSVVYEKENPLTAASSDLQDATIATVTNYHIDPSKVVEIYLQYKTLQAFEDNVIRPSVRDSIKTASAQFTANELVGKRAEFADRAAKLLNERFADKYIVIEQSNITDVKFSESFTQAIEAKVTAQQQAEKARNDLVRIELEGKQAIVRAQAEAEAIRLKSQAASNEKYVSLKALEVEEKAIEKWNGQLPTQFIPGSTMPFINLNNR